MSLGDRIRDWLDPGAPPRRRLRSQAQPFSSVGYEQRPLQRAQWVGLGLAAAAAIALTAGLVFVVLTLTRPGEGRGSATPTVSGLGSATPLPISAIFATSTPTSATSPTPLARPERVQVANTEGEGVNLRREPSLASQALRVILEGTMLDIVGPDRDADGRRWRNVRDLDGETGWIPSPYLVAEGTVPPPQSGASSGPPSPSQPGSAPPTARPTAHQAQVGNTDGQGANIRSEPGSAGKVLKTLPEGAAVEALGPEREADGRLWRQVRDSAGVTGWIVASALVAPGTVPTPAPPGSRPSATPTPGPSGPTPAPTGQPATPAPAVATATPAPPQATATKPTSATRTPTPEPTSAATPTRTPRPR